MRTTSTCPKCNSTDVISVKGNKLNQNHRISLDNWGLKYVVIDRYLCVRCGYTEEWLQMDDKFDRWVEKKWSSSHDEGFV